MCVQLQSTLSAAVFTVNPAECLDWVFGAKGVWTNQSAVLLCDDGAFPECVYLCSLLDGGLVQQRGEQGGVGRHAVEAAVMERRASRFMRSIEE